MDIHKQLARFARHVGCAQRKRDERGGWIDTPACLISPHFDRLDLSGMLAISFATTNPHHHPAHGRVAKDAADTAA